MYVVRLTPKGRPPNDKAFTALADARTRFNAAWHPDLRDHLDAAILFQVPDVTDAREAIDAVKAGRASIVERDQWADLDRAAAEIVADMIARGEATDA